MLIANLGFLCRQQGRKKQDRNFNSKILEGVVQKLCTYYIIVHTGFFKLIKELFKLAISYKIIYAPQ